MHWIGLMLLWVWPALAAPPEIRVRLLQDQVGTSVRVQMHGTMYLHAHPDLAPIARFRNNQTVTLHAREGWIFVEGPDGSIWTREAHLRPDRDGGFSLGSTGSTSRRYQGVLVASSEGTSLRLVHPIDLEAYVAAVVSREYGLDDVEGNKAMAVVARTYVLNRMASQRNAPFDVTDNISTQVFHGVGNLHPRAVDATRQTAGQVLYFQEFLASTTYFASSGGHTANSEDVWRGTAVPYLRAQPDPFDSVSPHSSWTSRLRRNEVLQALSQHYRTQVTGFVVADERTADGRSVRVRLLRSGQQALEVPATEFRTVLSARFGATSIRSTRFQAVREGDVYVFTGSGFGHGVGMSQWGAHGQARAGRSYTDILNFYYPGTRLGTIDPAQPLPPMPVVVDAQPPARSPAQASQPPTVQPAPSRPQTPPAETTPPRSRRRGW